MPRRRPGSVTAAAALAIIYGSCFTLCNACGMIGLAAQGAINQNFLGNADPQQAKLQKQMEEAMAHDIPAHGAVQVAAPIIGLVLAVALLIAGVGLLGLQPWARILALVAGMILVLYSLLQLIYQAIFVFPATNRVFNDALPKMMQQDGGPPPPPQLMQFMQGAMMMGLVFGILFQVAIIIYVLILVFLLLRSNVRVAFAGAPSEAADGLSEAIEEDGGWGKSAPSRRPEDDWGIQKGSDR